MMRITSKETLITSSKSISKATIPKSVLLTTAATTIRASANACRGGNVSPTTTTTTLKAVTNVTFSAQLLAHKVIMDATSILIAAKHTSTPPITTLRKVITLTTITKSTAETALWSLIRNACLVVFLFLTVLTLQHVNGQQLISTTIQTTTTTETAATFAVKSKNTIKIVTSIMKATTKTAEQPMRALLKVDISEKAGFHDGRTSRSDRAVKLQIPQQLAKKHQQIHKQYEQEPLLRQIQWSLKNIGMHLNSSNQWPYEVDVFSIGNNISQYKNIGHSDRADTIRTSQRNADHRQEIVQPSSSAAKRRSFLLNSKHSINFSNIDMEVPNIEDDYTRDDGLIHYSMRIYGKSNISNLLNQHPKTGWTRQTMRPIIAPDTNAVAPPRLQWRHRKKRSAIHLNPQLQSNGSNANPMSNSNTNSNTNNKSNQHYRLIALNFEGLLSNYEADMPKFVVRQQREEIIDVKSKDDVFGITDYDDSDTMKSVDKNTALIDNNSLTIDNSYLSERVNWNVQSRQFEHNEDNGRLLKLVMDGLRMQQLPDMKKVSNSLCIFAEIFIS
ncbi:uncharacterized protein LOC129250065 [Anastrepha obliqua]|uniref:uncharacterized protein LOC129250065 n=1 Tax=Anastrepha obliqua TaxID=95512 RepID=UPI00240A8779|nr:uncharacterized protein LOC129250065 [Anastrepha obliqua]